MKVTVNQLIKTKVLEHKNTRAFYPEYHADVTDYLIRLGENNIHSVRIVPDDECPSLYFFNDFSKVAVETISDADGDTEIEIDLYKRQGLAR